MIYIYQSGLEKGGNDEGGKRTFAVDLSLGKKKNGGGKKRSKLLQKGDRDVGGLLPRNRGEEF